MSLRQEIREFVERSGWLVLLDHLSDDTSLKDLHMDSLVLVQLSIELENEFQVEITSQDLQELTTVGDLLDLMERKHGQQRIGH